MSMVKVYYRTNAVRPVQSLLLSGKNTHEKAALLIAEHEFYNRRAASYIDEGITVTLWTEQGGMKLASTVKVNLKVSFELAKVEDRE